MIFSNIEFDFKDFMEVLDKCEGSVCICTDDGDKINVKSKLSQLVGFTKMISEGTIRIDHLKCEKVVDEGRIMRYLLYREINR
jgi:hypothetical protein